MDATMENRLPETFRGDNIESEDRGQGLRRQRESRSEGTIARMIEEQTAKVPSDVFLWTALGTMGLACILQMAGRKHESLFIGQWGPIFLTLGLYNKLVKVHGSDAASSSAS